MSGSIGHCGSIRCGYKTGKSPCTCPCEGCTQYAANLANLGPLPSAKEIRRGSIQEQRDKMEKVVYAARLVLLAWLGAGVDGGKTLREVALPGLREAFEEYGE